MNADTEPDLNFRPLPHEGTTPMTAGPLPNLPSYPATNSNPDLNPSGAPPPYSALWITTHDNSPIRYQAAAHEPSLSSSQDPNPYPSVSGEAQAQDPGLTPTQSYDQNPYSNPLSDPSTIPFPLSVAGLPIYPPLTQSPLPADGSDEPSPDLECAICFSQFNNVFRLPKMLSCKHTFCLECLARINVKSAQPDSIQCPLCRGLTALPTLGLPKLTTDSNVLSYLPAAMQRVYSIRFNRNKGKLQVKRPTVGRELGGRSVNSRRSVSHSLDVGLPSPPRQTSRERNTHGEMEGALLRWTGRPACRVFLLTSVVMLMALLTGIIIFLLTIKHNQ